MIGALAGDIIGSVYEGDGPRSKNFPLFVENSQSTDDSVLTVAIASAIRNGGDYGDAILKWGRRYPDAGYGGMFRRWLQSSRPAPYNSFGNGSAMRVSAVAWAFEDLKTVFAEASKSAECSHNHPEGLKGAQATAGAGRNGGSKDEIRSLISGRFGYDLSASLEYLRDHSTFDETCQGRCRRRPSPSSSRSTSRTRSGTVFRSGATSIPGRVLPDPLRKVSMAAYRKKSSTKRPFGWTTLSGRKPSHLQSNSPYPWPRVQGGIDSAEISFKDLRGPMSPGAGPQLAGSGRRNAFSNGVSRRSDPALSASLPRCRPSRCHP